MEWWPWTQWKEFQSFHSWHSVFSHRCVCTWESLAAIIEEIEQSRGRFLRGVLCFQIDWQEIKVVPKTARNFAGPNTFCCYTFNKDFLSQSRLGIYKLVHESVSQSHCVSMITWTPAWDMLIINNSALGILFLLLCTKVNYILSSRLGSLELLRTLVQICSALYPKSQIWRSFGGD